MTLAHSVLLPRMARSPFLTSSINPQDQYVLCCGWCAFQCPDKVKRWLRGGTAVLGTCLLTHNSPFLVLCALLNSRFTHYFCEGRCTISFIRQLSTDSETDKEQPLRTCGQNSQGKRQAVILALPLPSLVTWVDYSIFLTTGFLLPSKWGLDYPFVRILVRPKGANLGGTLRWHAQSGP